MIGKEALSIDARGGPKPSVLGKGVVGVRIFHNLAGQGSGRSTGVEQDFKSVTATHLNAERKRGR